MPLKICFRLTIFAIRLPPPMGPDNEPPPPCPLLPPPPPEPLRREPPPSKGWSKVAINLVPSIHTGSSRITVSRQSYAIPVRDWPPTSIFTCLHPSITLPQHYTSGAMGVPCIFSCKSEARSASPRSPTSILSRSMHVHTPRPCQQLCHIAYMDATSRTPTS